MCNPQGMALRYTIIRATIRDNADTQSPRRGSKIRNHLSYNVRQQRRLILKTQLQTNISSKPQIEKSADVQLPNAWPLSISFGVTVLSNF